LYSRTDRAVLAVNGFAADGNMFVKKVKQRLEVRTHQSLPSNILMQLRSGTVTLMQKICLYEQLQD
jgi:hypothetical protein